MEKVFPIHARTITGLEEVLAKELAFLGASKIEIKNRLVTCTGDLAVVYKANLWCRTAIRILIPIASFPATEEKHLYNGIKKLPWKKWVSATGTLAIDSQVHSSFTTHSLYISQLAKDAIVDQFRAATGERPSVDKERPDLRIAISLFQNFVQVYVDSSGDSLHKRGYRFKTGEAPVSETLAAGMIKLSEWDMTSPLVDPMCGSGTLLIEAGLQARNIAPGLFREWFGFKNWSNYDRSLYENLIKEAKLAIKRDVSPELLGLEIDSKVAAIARENIRRAGLEDLIKIEVGDFFQWKNFPATPGTLVMNPPYDERLKVEKIMQLFEDIGEQFKHTYAGWKAFLLSGNLEAIKAIRLRSSRRHILFNGSLECRLLKYEMRPKTSL